MNCPKCQRRLPDVAESCHCGWTRPADPESGSSQPYDGVFKRHYYPCTAYGCPLAGTISRSAGPNANLYCFVHESTEGHDMQAVTRLIRANRDLYAVYRAATVAGDRRAQDTAHRAFLAACTPRTREPGADDA